MPFRCGLLLRDAERSHASMLRLCSRGGPLLPPKAAGWGPGSGFCECHAYQQQCKRCALVDVLASSQAQPTLSLSRLKRLRCEGSWYAGVVCCNARVPADIRLARKIDGLCR